MLLTGLPTDPDALTVRGWRPIARLRGLLIRARLRLAHKERLSARAAAPTDSPDDAGRPEWPAAGRAPSHGA